MLHLYSKEVCEKGVNTVENNKKKKKGFTLIELIAVIAILGILAAIIVPNVQGYTAKANRAKVIADAKTAVQAISAYNADPQNTSIGDDIVLSTITQTELVGSTGTIKSWPKSISSLTFGQCKGIADGTTSFTVSSGAAIVTTSTN